MNSIFNENNWKTFLIVAAAIFSVLIISLSVLWYFQPTSEPYKNSVTQNELPTQLPPSINFKQLVDNSHKQAEVRNLEAINKYKLGFDSAFADYVRKFNLSSKSAAIQLSTWEEIYEIVKSLAIDQIKDQENTYAYINQRISPFIDPDLQTLVQTLNSIVSTLDNELRSSTLQLANDLAEIAIASGVQSNSIASNAGEPNLDAALKKLGIQTATIIPFTVVDLGQIAKTTLVDNTSRKVKAVTYRMFGKQIARLAASGGLSIVEGPLPVAKIFTILFGAWTAYDIATSRKEFENELQNSLNTYSNQTMESMASQAEKMRFDMLRANENAQTEICEKALISFLKES